MKILNRRLFAGLAVAALAAGGAVAVTTVPASAAATAVVGNTDGDGLNIRQAPSTASAAVGKAETGDTVTVSCQAYGEEVTNTRGFTSSLWDYSAELGGYLADAYMDTGYDGRIPGVDACDDGSVGQIVPIVQYQGQPSQWYDCGPTSVVVALLAIGVEPHGWSTSQVEAISQARVDMGLARDVPSYTDEGLVNVAFAGYGLDSWTSWDFDAILAHVRSGRPAVMAGNTVGLPWPVNVKNPQVGVGHFLTVAGYDSGTGEYLVVDPIAIDNSVKRASAGTLWSFFTGEHGLAAVLV